MLFDILGPLRVTNGDGAEISLGGAKPAALLAMLLVRPNEVVTADRLIEDLWEGEPPATAGKTLQVHVSRLRRALGDADDGLINTTGGGYVLELDADQVDALRFERLVTEGRAALAESAHARASARCREALALWRGDALADFTYASFAQDTIARLDGLRTVALESAVEAELALGRHSELIPELKFLVKRHPLSEHLRAQLMIALYRSGRQAEALGVYRSTRRILVDQLGIEPGEELRELERAILAQDAQLAAPAPKPRPRSERRGEGRRQPLVGCERELAALEEVLEDALSGRGGLALVAGEAGIGKTRLVDELSAVAEARAAHVAWGRCRSGGGAPAYWPWIQLLRTLTAASDDRALRTALGPGATDLVQLLPELRDRFPDVADPPAADADQARFRLFDAVATFLKRWSEHEPLVIVLDDLHAADRATLSLLEFVAPALIGTPILIVATYRDTDTDLEQPLKDTLNEVVRATDALQLVLTGLTQADTEHFVELSAQVAPMPRLAAALYNTSAGNPLFVSELVRLLRAENRLEELGEEGSLVLPRGVQQVIARRLERLSETCRATLAAGAVIGREFDLAVLERATSADADELLAQLDSAVAAGVVEPASGNSFRFSHDLVQQTLYAGLAAAERRRLHLAVAVALEHLEGDREVEALAHHFEAAMPAADAVKVVDYLARAGDAAAGLAAMEEAASYYERAAEIGRRSDADAATLCELYLRATEQRAALLDLKGALGPYAEAKSLLALAPDRARAARLAIVSAQMHLLDTDALDEAEVFGAIDLFRELDDPTSEARAWFAVEVINCGRSKRLEAGEAAERMLECARRSGNQSLISVAMRRVAGNILFGLGRVSEGIMRVKALIAEATDVDTRAHLLVKLGGLEALEGRFDDARGLLARAVELASAGGRADVLGYVYGRGANIEYLAGNLARAEELARLEYIDLEARGQVRFLSSEICFLIDPLIELGRLEEAEVQLERARAWTAPDDVDALLRQARSRGRLELTRGNLEAADAFAQEALDHIEGAEAIDEHAETLLLVATIAEQMGDDDEARAAATHALALAQQRGHKVFEQRARELLAAELVA